MHPTPASLRHILSRDRTIAVVGLSDSPQRPSHGVARYLLEQGYRIVPVTPRHAQVLGQTCYARLQDIPFVVDMVNVFRQESEIPAIAQSAVAIGAKTLWQQLGLRSAWAHELARAAGLDSVMDRCLKLEHARWMSA